MSTKSSELAMQLANSFIPFILHPPASNHIDEVRNAFAADIQRAMEAYHQEMIKDRPKEFKPSLFSHVMYLNMKCIITNAFVNGGKEVTISPVGNGTKSPPIYYTVDVRELRGCN
jgi:hypothetical protein